MVSADEFYSQLLKDIQTNQLVLPTLPEVALRVRDTVENEDVSAKEVASVISTDAALSARLIQVANSPMYRGSKQIEDIQTAVARLGFTTTRDIVTGLVMQQMFQATSEVTDKRLRHIWEHSTQVASISQVLCSQFTRLKKDHALLAGLVHDIGALPILVAAEDMPELLEDEAALDKLIKELHPRLGKIILESWHFLPEISAVAAEHEDLNRNSGDEIDYVDLVQVANLQSYIGSDNPLAKIDFDSVPACVKLGLGGDVNVIDMDGFEEIEDIQKSLMG
ncbi:HDOD domain-containing protein [Sulfuriflexus sp.]|uniref:HDOD domain-containing protein n=1 Tax=Sulfuriflexus sp. TaxID=2015443 RepID=UPI0028CDF505|nr:HDOD domain-containing protein [Sulfuriflexus sp.]MDT8402947.1 HDOD domain-containing protein [Sulfuriflexus sp.]